MKHKLKNAPPDTKRHVNYGRCLYAAFLAVTVVCGYTQPVVCYYIADKDIYEVVDGFHRYLVMKTCKDIYEREKGKLPVAVIDKPLGERIASTIRHNRARGSHDVDLMSNIVAELTELGKSNAWISKHLGMSADEVLRLKQITGLAALFKDDEFSRAWE